VSAVCVLPPDEEFPNGLIVTGSNDHVIHAYTLDSPEPKFKLTGHTDNGRSVWVVLLSFLNEKVTMYVLGIVHSYFKLFWLHINFYLLHVLLLPRDTVLALHGICYSAVSHFCVHQSVILHLSITSWSCNKMAKHVQWWDQDSKGKTKTLGPKTQTDTKTVTFRLQDKNKTVTLLTFKNSEQTQWRHMS